MNPSALKALKRLCKLYQDELDAARKDLSECLSEESRLEASIRESYERIEYNTKLMSEDEHKYDGLMMSSFRSWLPKAKDNIEQKSYELSFAQQKTHEARDVVNAALKQQKSTELLITREEDKIKAERVRKEQLELDEMAQNIYVRTEIENRNALEKLIKK